MKAVLGCLDWFLGWRWRKPKTSLALTPAQVAYEAQRGLRKGFVVGQGIPLNGILFRVSQVDPDTLHLEATGMTARRAKQLKGAKRGRPR